MKVCEAGPLAPETRSIKSASRWAASMLGLPRGWKVSGVEEAGSGGEVAYTARVERTSRAALRCPECNARGVAYGTRRRRWRGLDACGRRLDLECDLPRVRCAEHGVKCIKAPWAERGSRYTAAFEAKVIDLLRGGMTVAAAMRELRIGWKAVRGVMRRAVKRGEERRAAARPLRLSFDEVAFAKRQSYVTVMLDPDSGAVLHVEPGRSRAAMRACYETLHPDVLARLESVSMDMWRPYISETRAWVPDADRKICYDPFHVMRRFTAAVDRERRQETKALAAAGDGSLKGSRFLWLWREDKLGRTQRATLAELCKTCRRTARAWALKELASNLWHYTSRTWALKGWSKLLAWAQRSRLESMVKVGRMVRRHLDGIINACVLGASNARSESLNGRIRQLRVRCRGFRSVESYRDAIMFHFGKLDLYPAGTVPSVPVR